MFIDKPYHVIADKWNCLMVKEASALNRKEIFHLLADVEDTEDDTKTRSSRRAVFLRHENGRRFAGYLYFCR